VNGVELTVTLHLRLIAGGWTDKTDSRERWRSSLVARRLHFKTGGYDANEASPAAKKQILAKVIPVVAQWLESPEGKAALAVAEEADAKFQISRAAQELEEANKAVAEALSVYRAAMIRHRAAALAAGQFPTSTMN
jgi:hypothetical protein